jgi:hypothetical protein
MTKTDALVLAYKVEEELSKQEMECAKQFKELNPDFGRERDLIMSHYLIAYQRFYTEFCNKLEEVSEN